MFLINIHSVLLSEIIQELQWKPVKQIASWEKNPTLLVNSSSVSNHSMRPAWLICGLTLEDLNSIQVFLKRLCGLNLHPDCADCWLQCRYVRVHQQIDVSLHPGLVKRIDTLNRSFSLIDQYSIVLQIQVHSVVWVVKKINTQIQCHFCSWDQCRETGCCSRISPSACFQPVLSSSKISHNLSNSAGLAKCSLLHKVNCFSPSEKKKQQTN